MNDLVDLESAGKHGEHVSMLVDRRMIRPTLVVVGDDAVDVVRAAGGWIADLVWTGWVAFAVLRRGGHESALRVLGAVEASVDEAVATCQRRPRPRVIAVGAQSFRSDERVAQWVVDSTNGSGEVRLWGEGCGDEFQFTTKAIDYQPSPGALAFKREALEITGCSVHVARVESFAKVRGCKKRG